MSKKATGRQILRCVCLCITITTAACRSPVPEVSADQIYHHKPEVKYDGPGARNIRVASLVDGTLGCERLAEDAFVPVTLTKGSFTTPGRIDFVLDALGSQNVLVVINKEVGHTDFAGLRFQAPASINIWKDGTIEVDAEGVEVTDKLGNKWVSRKVSIGGKRSIVMVRKQ